MKRVIFYFDGFNFYNGLKDACAKNSVWKNYYWIDFIVFANQFLSEKHDLQCVKYFTSPPSNAGKKIRQNSLFKANQLLNGEKFKVINGQFQNRKIVCRADCELEFEHPEEKKTDVAIAVHMVSDCYQNKVDTLVLVSADCDQVPAIKEIKNNFPEKEIKIYFPPERKSTELFDLCKPIVFLRENESRFKKSIMATNVEKNGKKYYKPREWNQ